MARVDDACFRSLWIIIVQEESRAGRTGATRRGRAGIGARIREGGGFDLNNTESIYPRSPLVCFDDGKLYRTRKRSLGKRSLGKLSGARHLTTRTRSAIRHAARNKLTRARESDIDMDMGERNTFTAVVIFVA